MLLFTFDLVLDKASVDGYLSLVTRSIKPSQATQDMPQLLKSGRITVAL